jgi:hypothetical protein
MENEDELDTELETESPSTGETEPVEDGSEDGSGSPDGNAAPDASSSVEKKPTVEDAIADALKALEPKTAEQKAAEATAATAAAKKAADEKAGVKPADEPKLDKDGKPIVDAKKADHVNDPIPPQVSERTRERITSLVSTVKDLTAISENQGAIIASIQETGATPEEFGAMITYMRYMHSDKATDLEEAYKMLQGGLRTVSMKLGRSLPEADALEGHQDLIDAVAGGHTTAKIAEEVAVARNRARANNASSQAMTTAAQAEAATAQERTTAIADLNGIGDHLQKTDPNYAAKREAIEPALMAAFKHMRPTLWKQAFNEAYAACKATAKVVAPVVVVPAKPKPQPLRPGAPAGGGTRVAGNLHDAIFGDGFPG